MGGEESRERQNRALGIELGHRVKTLLPGNLWSGEGVKALNSDAKKSCSEGKLRVTGRVERSIKNRVLQTRREDGGGSVTMEAWGQELNSGPVGSLWLLYEQVAMEGKGVEKGWNTI